ncbi:hypothetical protein ASF71_06990 [Deinococcus sp. Leaf326]|nr:hypothetical protein ASF71_06990 [Deinococcus sp. Leaf326]
MTQAMYAAPFLSLEDRRELIHQQVATLRRDRVALADEVARLYADWSKLYPGSSTADFIRWHEYGAATVDRSWYTYLQAGQARQHVRLPDTRMGFWTDVHKALGGGVTPAEVQLAYQLGGVEAVRALKPKRETTTLSIPSALAPEIREGIRAASNSDGPSAEDNAAVLQAHFSLPASVQRAGMAQQATGQDFTSALAEAAETRRDVRAWLAEQGCIVPGCGVKPVQLHHLRVFPDVRFRTYELVIPCCQRHHIARPGDTTDAAHGATQEAWALQWFGGLAQLFAIVALLYATWAEAQRGNQP